MKMAEEIPLTLIAACGITCAACRAHLRKKKPCPGCRFESVDKSTSCQFCKIKQCAQEHNLEMCVDCASFPCEKIRHIDQRYRNRYRQSLIDNAVRLRAVGPAVYLREERQKWLCADCGGVISLHDWVCSECGKAV